MISYQCPNHRDNQYQCSQDSDFGNINNNVTISGDIDFIIAKIFAKIKDFMSPLEKKIYHA